MQNKFTQPVSLQVTKEQYEKDLREPLLRMGYLELGVVEWVAAPVLVTNYGNSGFYISNTINEYKKRHNRYFVPEYNPEYFLAVAAMTNEELGIVGEWWKCINDVVMESNKITYYNNKLYKSELENCITNTDGNKYHMWSIYSRLFKYFTKATLSDLINHFEQKTNKNTNNMELTEKEKEVLAKLVNKDNEAIFEKIGVKRDKNPIKRLSTENETLKSILRYICVAFESAEAIDRKDLIGRSFTFNAQNTYKFILH